jgi:hypothetical protein
MRSILLGACLLTIAAPLAAQVDTDCTIGGWTCYRVDRFDDVASATACTAAPADCSLRGALTRANQDGGKSKLRMTPGDYVLSLEGADEDGNLTGDLDVADRTKIAPSGSGAVTITQVASDRIFHLQPGAGTVILQDLTLSGGFSTGNPAHGGSILAEGNGGLTLTRTALSGAVAAGQGGCLDYELPTADGSQLLLDGATLTGCQCWLEGGGLRIDAPGTTVEIRDSELRDNLSNASGGGLYVVAGDVTVWRTTFDGNAAGSAGFPGWGGGIYLEAGGALSLQDSTVSNNRAGVNGSTEGYGGGILTLDPSLVVRNSTLSGNRAAGTSGQAGTEVHVAYPSGSVIFDHATVVRGAAEAGRAAVYVSLSVSAYFGRSLVDGGCDVAGIVATIGSNVVRPEPAASGCGLSDPTDLEVPDLRLRPLAGYGGPTRTHEPFADSPALGHVATGCGFYDQRGAARGSTCDAGSFELAPMIPPPGPWIFADGFDSGNVLAWSSATL